MPGFEQGDVIRVPFPYTDRSTRQRRPALVVSRGGLGEDGRLIWVAMITSAENRAWPDDVPFGDTYARQAFRRRRSFVPANLRRLKAVTPRKSDA